MRHGLGLMLATAALASGESAALGQAMRTVDPNQAAASASRPVQAEPEPVPLDEPAAPAPAPSTARESAPSAPPRAAVPADDRPSNAESAAREASVRGTYQENDVVSAAEGVFGKGAEGLAKLIEDIFKKQGRPTAYIAGREAGGAIVAGVRYGSGTLFHKVEGERPIYWTGPSVGFDLGANGAKTFVLVYNLYDTQDLFRRFPAAEGNVYVVGGFTASYLRWKDMVVIPIRLGVGWRLGANLGYMRFTEKRKWSPF